MAPCKISPRPRRRTTRRIEPSERIEIDERLAWFLVLSHRIDEGSAHADRTRGEAEAAGLVDLVVRIDAVRSLVRALTGDMPGAVELAEDVHVRARGNETTRTRRRRRCSCSADCVAGRATSRGALELLRPATDATKTLSFPVLTGLANRWLLLTLVDAGDWASVEQLASALLVRGDEAGDTHTAATAHHAMGVLARDLGDVARAERSGETALAQATEGRVRPAERVTMVLSLAASALRRGDDAAAESRLQQAAALVAEDAWLSWRSKPFSISTGPRRRSGAGRAPTLRSQAVGAARASLDGAEARVERARLLLLEAQAEALLGACRRGGRGCGEALETARDLDHPALIVDAAVALARQRSPHRGDDEARSRPSARSRASRRSCRPTGRTSSPRVRGSQPSASHRNVNPRPSERSR